MTTYAEAAAGVNRQQSSHSHGSPVPMVSDGSCSASGCPMPGTLSTSTNGTDEWLCSWHFGAPYGEYGAITARIANRMGIIRQAIRMANSAPGNSFMTTDDQGNDVVRADLVALLQKYGYANILDNLPPTMKRCNRNLGSALLSALGREIRSPEQRLHPAPTRQPEPGTANQWVDSRAAVAMMREVANQRKVA